MNHTLLFRQQACLASLCIVCFSGASQSIAKPDPSNPILKIGIVQRFGAKPDDTMTLRAADGGALTLRFTGSDGNKISVKTNEVTVSISELPLSTPIVEEKIILSHHRSFENAAASAFHWEEQGIPTEIAQPRRWQVWVKRDVYDSWVSRAALFYVLALKGNPTVSLDRQVLQKKPVLTWVANGFRYNRDQLELSSSTGVITVNHRDQKNRPYGGTMQLQPNAHNSFTLVNQVPLETYLRGVVPHEIGYNAPYSAVQAQAVLARTYVLASAHRFKVDNYELCADTQCQVYRGLEDTTELADNAIRDTRGQVLTYKDRVIDALYSSTTGGVTANYNDIWDGTPRPYLLPIVDVTTGSLAVQNLQLNDEKRFQSFIANPPGPMNESGWRNFRWQRSSSLGEMTKSLQKFLKLSGDQETKFKQIKQVKVTERALSGRVQALEVETDTGKIIVKKDEIIDAFDAPDSTLFYLKPEYELNPKNPKQPILKGYTFVGGGLGHGVGMSQTGSYRLAKEGWNYSRILNFYYTNTQLKTLRSEFWQ